MGETESATGAIVDASDVPELEVAWVCPERVAAGAGAALEVKAARSALKVPDLGAEVPVSFEGA